eukprot:TRINITY_DN28957_c0_g1_i4.p1 TRINITY_DN28957_c0_g1~~TRINITY_DN28957_c0_g1_i4.p1  ORF type:complete len:296 (+),score=53.73 TRINITY_DN28957_c0_g1_i4:1097-1984(+)
MHVRKVVEETKKEATESASADLASAKAMFSDYDKNGDGVLDRQELSQVLEDLGIDARCIDYFLRDLDKNNDGVVSYEEFLNWVCKDLMEESPAEADDGCASPRARPVVDRLTTADLAQCLSLPSDWPVDGTPLFNTMHMRFPHCTFSTIVSELQRQKYDGALVIKALKASGAVEAEALSETAEISLNALGRMGQPLFPAEYETRLSVDGMPVFSERDTNWSFANLRDEKLRVVSGLPVGTVFTVTQVRRCTLRGACFGRVEAYGLPLSKTIGHWVCLGMAMGGWNFTAARRLTRL